MDTFFILVIFLLTVPAFVGLIFETKFWYDQARTINDLSNKLHSKTIANISNWLSQELGEQHSLIPALKRILATDHAPEASVDLIEPSNWYIRFLIGWRRYAITVVLLCGIAGTLFSLHAAIPLDGNFAPHQLQTALTHAFWPSIWGVISTLLLQLMRFAFLEPIQRKAELDFVALVSNRLIPWTLQHKNASKAFVEATSKLQTVVDAFTNAANAGVAAITTGSEKANQSFEQFDTTVDNACKNLSNAFENSAKHISAVGTASVSTIATSVQHTEQTITVLGVALSPIVQRMEGVTTNLKKAADRFDQSVAANGPFLKAMEQLYKASNPAEERYEKLLVAIMEMQKLSTTQNTILLQLHQETAKLTLSTIRTADESVQLAQTLQTTTATLPPALLAFTKNSDALTTIAKQWQSDINDLTAQFQKLLIELKTASGTQQQLANDAFTKIEAVATNFTAAIHLFDQSVAANSPFLKAMEQLYNASNPAEKRYEQLLHAVLEMQKLSTTQNTILLQLHQEIAKLTLSTIRTADESVQLAQTLQTTTANLPPVLLAVIKNSDALTTIAKQWQSDIKRLTTEFEKLSLELKTASGTQQQLANDTLVKLPSMIAHALATKLPQELAPLVSSVTLAGQHISDIGKNIISLQTAIENISMEMRRSNSKSPIAIPDTLLSKKRKWYKLWGN